MWHQDIVEKFWSLVAVCEHGRDCKECCWLWQGRMVKGYGVLSLPKRYRRGKTPDVRVGRLCLEIITGVPLELPFHALHDCPQGDNPRCVSQWHLRAGTHQENMEDAWKKGRIAQGATHGRTTRPDSVKRGEENHYAILTAEQVYAIREYGRLGYPHWQIAEAYNTSRTNVQHILDGDSWQHLPPREETNFINIIGPIQRRNRKGETSSTAKLTDRQVILIRRLAEQGMRKTSIARIFDISPSLASMVALRKVWTHVKD